MEEFSRLRAFFWPIHRHEFKKFFPLLALFFLVCFSYNILRTMKDTLVVTGKASGAEVIPFIKVWIILPGSILITTLFTALSNRFSRETVFYAMMGLFLSYFIFFTYILYPNQEFFHLNDAADAAEKALPAGFKGLIAMCRNWTFTLFYALSELWGNVVIFILFWGFANQITRLEEAKRFYGLLGVGANFSGVVTGYLSVQICRGRCWEDSLHILLALVVLAGFLAIGIFFWMNRTVLKDPRYYDPADALKDRQSKGKLSLLDSVRHLLGSRYLLCIAAIVLSYNVVINMVEIIWQHEVKELYPDPGNYNVYMNGITAIVGCIATFTSLFISGNAIRRLGWLTTAMMTPLVLFLGNFLFLGAFFYRDSLPSLLSFTPLGLVVFLGSLQNILGRAAKYTVFDATREMAFVPLSPESKLKGKAVIDGICSRLGKSGGSIIHQSLLLAFSTISASAPYAAVVLFSVIAAWVAATSRLGKEFEKEEVAVNV